MLRSVEHLDPMLGCDIHHCHSTLTFDHYKLTPTIGALRWLRCVRKVAARVAENVKDIARYFRVSAGFLYFGETSNTSNIKGDDDLSSDARLVAKAWSLLPERFAKPLAVDTFKLFEALTDREQDRALHIEVKQALERLTKGS